MTHKLYIVYIVYIVYNINKYNIQYKLIVYFVTYKIDE